MLEIVPDIAQSTHGIKNILVDNRNVPTRPHMVLGMFLLAFPVPVSSPKSSGVGWQWHMAFSNRRNVPTGQVFDDG